MRKIFFYSLLNLFVLFCISDINAQKIQRHIIGIVKDTISDKYLASVSVILEKDSYAITFKSTSTNNEGIFEFSNIDTGKYLLIFSYIGFAEKKISLAVNAEKDFKLGEIILVPLANTLKEIVVKSIRSLFEVTDDKIIYNVQNDPTAKTQSVTELLRKIPFVSVDGQGNVLLNGQKNFKVLLNGKETAMFSQNIKEALKGFPGSLVSKIEVITSPSAKYDGEGMGGIINIITLKKVLGYNSSISTYYTNTNFYNFSSSINAKVGKWGFTIFYGGGGLNGQYGESKSETIPLVQSSFNHRLINGTKSNLNFAGSGSAEINFDVDSLNTITLYSTLSGGWNKSKLNQVIQTEFSSALSSRSTYTSNISNNYPTMNVGGEYIRKFKGNEAKELSIRYNQEIGGNNFLSNSVLDEVNNIDRFVANNNKAKNNQNTIQADYTQDLKKNQKFDIGVKAILRTASSEFKSLIKFNEADKYEFNPSNSDYFKFYQTVYSMYGTYSFKVKSISIRSGYRIEHTATNGNFAASMMKVERSYVNLLPNVQISFKVLPAVTLLLNYNKRIQRPFIWNLNPFVNNNDTFNISSGNPTLNPQAIHNFSAQTKIFKGQSFAALALMISYSNNLIIQYSVFEPAIGRINTIPDNIGKEFQMSLNGTLSTKINQDWNVFFNGNIRYNRIRNKFFPEQVNHGIGGNGTMNSTYSIFKNFQLSSYAGFWKSPVTIQNQQNISYWYGIGIGYKMLGEKLSVSIDVANFLKQKVSNYSITEDPSFNMKTINITPFRSIGLSISWNFGKLSGNTSKKRGVNNDDIIANQQPNN